jgi:hypothetical protein
MSAQLDVAAVVMGGSARVLPVASRSWRNDAHRPHG